MMAIEKDAVTTSHWSLEQYQAVFAQNANLLALVAEEVVEEADKVQGFLIARFLDQEWEIENIAIASPVRRRGLGSGILARFLELARERGAQAIFLEVRESNSAARALYKKFAFVLAGRRPRYYNNPEEDAIIYRRVSP
jgi:[ribosomal protein S18]-alanine N-acetyltransferase